MLKLKNYHPLKLKREKGTDVEQLLERWFHFLERSPHTLISDVYPAFQFNDEPKMHLFKAETALKNKDHFFGTDGAGFSFSSMELALVKCLSEAAERISLFTPLTEDVQASYSQLMEKHYNCIDPTRISTFSQQQISVSDSFRWVTGNDLHTLDPVLVPQQLVSLGYKKPKEEPWIQLPISTGAACHSTFKEACYQGICECIERDAFMLRYLTKTSRKQIDLLSHPILKKIYQKVTQYNLELYVIDITSDIEVPTFMSIVIDQSGHGPSITTGLKADFDPLNAIIGAVEESFHPRNWIRNLLNLNKPKLKHAHDIKNLEDRALFWADPGMIKNLDFFIKSKKKPFLSATKPKKSNYYKQIMQICQKHRLSVIAVDITHRDLKAIGLKVVKIIMPELQPLYLQESHRVWDEKRLLVANTDFKSGEKPHSLGELNQVPHPFL